MSVSNLGELNSFLRYLIINNFQQDEVEMMPGEKFENIKKVLKVKKTPKLLTLSDQFGQFFREIATQQYHFNRVNVEASILKSITHDEVLNFYKVRIDG